MHPDRYTTGHSCALSGVAGLPQIPQTAHRLVAQHLPHFGIVRFWVF